MYRFKFNSSNNPIRFRSPLKRRSPSGYTKHSPMKRSPLSYAVRHSSVRHSPVRHSPVRHSPVRYSPMRYNMKRSPKKHSPIKRFYMKHSPVRHNSPMRYSPVRHSPVRHSPVRHSPVRHSPVRHSPVRHSPVRHSPVRHSSAIHSPMKRSPLKRKNKEKLIKLAKSLTLNDVSNAYTLAKTLKPYYNKYKEGKKWTIYVLKGCPACSYAKGLLKKYNQPYEEIDGPSNKDRWNTINYLNGVKHETYPKIVNPQGKYIGGSGELEAILNSK